MWTERASPCLFGLRAESPFSQDITTQKIQCFKTKKCRFWLEGRCARGSSCTYAHTETEMREAPDLAKTKICSKWKRGTCMKPANRCSYAHGIKDLREMPISGMDSELLGCLESQEMSSDEETDAPQDCREGDWLISGTTNTSDSCNGYYSESDESEAVYEPVSRYQVSNVKKDSCMSEQLYRVNSTEDQWDSSTPSTVASPTCPAESPYCVLIKNLQTDRQVLFQRMRCYSFDELMRSTYQLYED